MEIIKNIKNKILESKKRITIVFPEGWNKIIQKAANILKDENLIEPLLIFRNELELSNFENKKSIKTFLINNENIKYYQNMLYELRKEKGITIEESNKLASQPNYLGSLLVKSSINFGMVCGIEYTTKDTIRAALQVVKSKKDVEIVTSAMIMEKNKELIILSDIGLSINPNSSELVCITNNAIEFATKKLEIKNNNVALLSYSTNGSGKGESVEKVQKAFKTLKNLYNKNKNINIAGEIQFDAAVNERIRKIKYKNCELKDNANIFIFPNLDAGNISYKIFQQIGNYSVIGPILLGLNSPINDLSRGADVDEVLSLTYITALQVI